MKQKILKVLESTDGYVSGEQLSKMLGVSRTAVWKNIKVLRSEGYKIDSVTNRGYRLTEKPEMLDAEKISQGLETSLIRKIEVMKTVDSTNEAEAQIKIRRTERYCDRCGKADGRQGQTRQGVEL